MSSNAGEKNCGLVESARAWDGTGCEFIEPIGLLGSPRGSLGTYGLIRKFCKNE